MVLEYLVHLAVEQSFRRLMGQLFVVSRHCHIPRRMAGNRRVLEQIVVLVLELLHGLSLLGLFSLVIGLLSFELLAHIGKLRQLLVKKRLVHILLQINPVWDFHLEQRIYLLGIRHSVEPLNGAGVNVWHDSFSPFCVF